MRQFESEDFELRMLSTRAAVAGFKRCSRDHTDKSVYDLVHHADSVGCSPALQILRLELCCVF